MILAIFTLYVFVIRKNVKICKRKLKTRPIIFAKKKFQKKEEIPEVIEPIQDVEEIAPIWEEVAEDVEEVPEVEGAVADDVERVVTGIGSAAIIQTWLLPLLWEKKISFNNGEISPKETKSRTTLCNESSGASQW